MRITSALQETGKKDRKTGLFLKMQENQPLASQFSAQESNFYSLAIFLTLRLHTSHYHQLECTVMNHYAGCDDETWNLPSF